MFGGIVLLTMVGGPLLLLPQINSANGFRTNSFLTQGCEGANFTMKCPQFRTDELTLDAHMVLLTVTVVTNPNTTAITKQTASRTGCAQSDCLRKIYNATDTGINDDYKYLYQYISSSCQGRTNCTLNMPEYWNLVDNSRACNDMLQYFSGVIIDVECRVGDDIPTAPPPISTTPRTKPTVPTTTTPFPVIFAIYQPTLVGYEQAVLGAAIGLSIAILIVLLIVIYCCEQYRNNKKFGRLLRTLGAPQAQQDAYDELDYGRAEGWDSENRDALGEYTGVKPDEFLTLDKHAMESSGQIMYDAPMGTLQKGVSCSTIDRLDRKKGGAGLTAANDYSGPIDYSTEENIEVEKRMAAVLKAEEDSGTYEDDSF
ncbi:uncharacterized protein [Watersipora subatra]|uniref:uncharacterized protein n=1 Tax=Watersipora subatra TaxID=2589382 RepID=UPI00355BADE5